MSCSVYFGSGSCDVAVSDDWESLSFNLEFAPGALGSQVVNAEITFQGYEADPTNNLATHNFVAKVIRPATNDVDGEANPICYGAVIPKAGTSCGLWMVRQRQRQSRLTWSPVPPGIWLARVITMLTASRTYSGAITSPDKTLFT